MYKVGCVGRMSGCIEREILEVKSENRTQVTDVIRKTALEGGRSGAWARATAAFHSRVGRCVQLWRARQKNSKELAATRTLKRS